MPVLVLTPTFNTDNTLSRPASDWNNNFSGNRMELGRRFGKGFLEKANFYQWQGMLIPKDSTINSANLRVTASLAGRGTVFTCTVRGMDRDGLWNSDATGLDFRKAETVGPAFHFCNNQVEIFSGAMVSELLTQGNMNISDNKVRLNSEVDWERVSKIAQTITPTSTFTLTSVSFAMVQSIIAVPPGNVFLEIRSVDGAGKPTGVVLATSDIRLCSSIAGGLLAVLNNFIFSGADQITITSGVKFAVVMNITYPPAAFANLESGVRGGLTDSYTGGELWSYGNGRGFDDNNYPCAAILEEDIPRTTASATMSLPFPSPAGTNVDTDVAAIIQETVDDAGYTNTGRIALAILPDGATTQDNDIFQVETVPLVGPILTIDFTEPPIIIVPRQIEICVDGQVEPTVELEGDADDVLALGADVQPALTLAGQILALAPQGRIDDVQDVSGDVAGALPLVGQVDPISTLQARVDPIVSLVARIVDQLSLVGQILEFINVEGRALATLGLTGIIEDC